MTRLLLFFALIAFTVYIIRKLYLPNAQEEQQQNPQLMKKCAQCSMHIPEQQGVHHNDLFFCSEAHRNEFLNT